MPPRKHGESNSSITDGLALANKTEAMSQILDRLENLTDKSGRLISELFMELPDREEYPDYYVTITNPIAFDIIRDRLQSGAYNNDNISSFANDLRTLTANAKEYNRKGSPIHRDATTLENQIEAAMQVLLDDNSLQEEQEQASTIYLHAIGMHPFGDLCNRVLKTIKGHRDESGRLMSELFLELPSHEEYPDYYEEIARPIALDGIKKKINNGAYKNLESFEEDFDLMFDNARQYNAEGSDVYLDAEELQQVFWKEIGKDGRNVKNKNARTHAKELTQIVLNGITYSAGDFVHLRNERDPSKPLIALIYGLWEDENGQTGLDATWFLRPEQIVHSYTSRFYPSEVVKASGPHEHLVDEIQERCFVLYTRDFVRGRPVDWRQGQSIYVCEQRYSESSKTVTKIKNWASILPPGRKPSDIKFNLFPEPLVLKKLPSASMVEKAGKHDYGEGASRSSTPQDMRGTGGAMAGAGHQRSSIHSHPGSPPMSKIPNQHTPQQIPSHWVRCNYSSLSTGLQCPAVFPTQGDLQRHVATEHAITQQVAAPPAMKRGRPRKNPLPATASTAAPAQSMASQNNAALQQQQQQQQPGMMMGQPGAYPQQPYNAYSPAGPYGAVPPRPNMPFTQQPMQSMQQMQQQQRGMPFPQQPGQPRPPTSQSFPQQGVPPHGQQFGQPQYPQQQQQQQQQQPQQQQALPPHSQYPQQQVQQFGQPQFPQQGFSPEGYPQQQAQQQQQAAQYSEAFSHPSSADHGRMSPALLKTDGGPGTMLSPKVVDLFAHNDKGHVLWFATPPLDVVPQQPL
ncbi:hypothetical protein KVV02_004993 [Mortierella alpina]|uniref:Uncharacterized protein n=1 Tax=Mortierella alpina TaxID=64518 RepID=A0A9P7ZYG3_MORAP|nr:hypothetical protein KVV02_004993 [Mortierella alpina]